ncbi:Dom-3 Z [Linnemannia zychae]|nr:Dom-3 Z [Linnemannia zychae]
MGLALVGFLQQVTKEEGTDLKAMDFVHQKARIRRKYYFPPDLTKPNNLSVNYEKYITRDPMVNEHIDALLDALVCIRDREQKHQQQQQEEDRLKEQNTVTMTQANFICYRGLLTKIMCTPYARNEPWEMGATLYNGSIYIEEHVSDEKRINALGSNDRHKLMSYWGYRFETICNISKPVSELRRVSKPTLKRGAATQLDTRHGGSDSPQSKVSKVEADVDQQSDSQGPVEDSDKPAAEQVEEKEEEDEVDGLTKMTDQIDLEDPELTGRLDGIVDTNLQYCTVARTKIGNNSIIMGAEVDCTSEPKKAPPHNPLSNYIELKTSRVISNAREQNNFEKHKLLKFWAQSFLPGIPTIIVGFRDDDGNVVTVETFKTMEIPRLVRGKEGAWDTTICINFLDAVLNFLRKQVKVDNPRASYTIRWAPPYKAIEVEYNGEGSSSFLTDRFLKSYNES